MIRCCILLLAASLAWAADDTVMKAMRDEMSRSMEKLQLEKLEKPYFLAYRIQDRSNAGVKAAFGSLLSSGESRMRLLTVEVRVGDRKLDNTGFVSIPFGPSGVVRSFGGVVRLPLEDNYDELRRQIWLATDGAYKKALEDLSLKRAALQNKTRTDDTPDFSTEDPVNTDALAPGLSLDLADPEKLLRDLSTLFKSMPGVFNSSLSLTLNNVHTRYVSSEGASFNRQTPFLSFNATAATQASDGSPIEDFVARFGRAMGPGFRQEDLAPLVRNLGERLEKLRNAATIDQYNGPVLFEGDAAAELVAQVLTPRLLAVRRQLTDNPQVEMMLSQGDNPFVDKIGSRVLSRFLQVTDNPTLSSQDGQPLAGGYAVDDDGVRARETRLIENGVLKTLLASRVPVRGVLRSTGNRRGGGPVPSNLLVTAENGLDDAAMRAELLSLVKQRNKEYGIVVRRVSNPTFRASRDSAMAMSMMMSQGRQGPAIECVLAYKVFPDGREELIRNAELSGLSDSAFKDIVAASRNRVVYTVPFSVRGANPFGAMVDSGEGAPPVSFVVPSLLFEDVTIKKPSGPIPNLPATRHPYFDK